MYVDKRCDIDVSNAVTSPCQHGWLSVDIWFQWFMSIYESGHDWKKILYSICQKIITVFPKISYSLA